MFIYLFINIIFRLSFPLSGALVFSLRDCYDEKQYIFPYRHGVLTARSQSKSIHLFAVDQLYRLQPPPNPSFHLRPKPQPCLLLLKRERGVNEGLITGVSV